MRYSKTILCLANSRKLSGRCIAGKEVIAGQFGDWIRPVSSRATEEISEEERCYENGESPSVLDIIQIPMLRHKPESYQSENHLIDDNSYWQRIRCASWQEVVESTDSIHGDLWINGYHSASGENDRIPENEAKQLDNSLLLIEPKHLVIHFTEYQQKRQVRAKFHLNEQRYNFRVTDPKIEKHYLKMKNGEHPISGARLCLSLGEIFNEYTYKLIASVITEERARRGQ